uniref:MGAT4 conserved region domain-containing protein n=1 Tax=Ciona savignyi TaxID=51511 RepID=H2YC56_CIOSA
MVTSYGIRLILAICFALSFGALIINTNIMLSVHSVISKKRLSSLFHDELQHVLVDFNGAFIHQNSKQSSSNLNLPFSHFPQHTVDFDFDTSDNSDISPFLYKKNFTPSLVLGHGPSAPVSFVIGIPSIKRSGVSYLYATLTSLFRNMYPVNENKTLVVVFLAETDSNYVNATMSEIYQNFTREVDMGFLQVISPPENLYPSFNLPQTLGDPMDRLRWRSKEVFD